MFEGVAFQTRRQLGHGETVDDLAGNDEARRGVAARRY